MLKRRVSREEFEKVLAELDSMGFEVTAVNVGRPLRGEYEIEYQKKSPKGNGNDEQKELFVD